MRASQGSVLVVAESGKSRKSDLISGKENFVGITFILLKNELLVPNRFYYRCIFLAADMAGFDLTKWF